jgi:hypothetical protein
MGTTYTIHQEIENMTKKLKAAAVTLSVAIMLFALAGCPKGDPYQRATTAVHKYAVSLQDFQSAEIKAHRDLDGSGKPFIDDDLHRSLETDIKAAAHAGADVDTGILSAKQGGDPSAYVDAAFTTIDKVNSEILLIKDPVKRQELSLAIKAARDILVTGLQSFKH